MEFSRQGLEWVAISFPRGSSHPKDWTQVSHIAGRRFTVWATREALWVTWLNPSTMNPGGLEWVLGGRNSWNLGTDPLQAVHGQREFPSWEQKWPVCAWYSGRKMVKNLPALWETWLQSLGWEDPRRREWLPTSVFLPGESPWTEEPDWLQSMGSQRVRHNWMAFTFHFHSGRNSVYIFWWAWIFCVWV